MFGISRPPLLEKPDSFVFQNWFSGIADYARSQIGVVTKSSDYQVNENVFLVRANCTSNAVVATLPPAANFIGRQIAIKKIDASGNAATLDGHLSETIDGTGTVSTTTQYATITVISNGTGWDKL
jgi:hypothetical protein